MKPVTFEVLYFHMQLELLRLDAIASTEACPLSVAVGSFRTYIESLPVRIN